MSLRTINDCEPIILFDLGVECQTLASPTTSTSTDGAITLIITGGTTPYTILWDNGRIGPKISNLSQGDYGVTVVDYYGDYTARTVCSLYGPEPSPTPTITPTPTPTNIPVYPNLCFILYYPSVTYGPWSFILNGEQNGRPKWTYTSGSTQYNIVWTTYTVPNRWEMEGWSYNGGVLVSENQSYVPSANNWKELGASNNVTVSVIEGDCPTLLPLRTTISSTDSSCSGGLNCNGNITIIATGGQPPYQYSINGGATYQTLNTFNNLCPQTYSVITKDSLGYRVVESVTIGTSGTLTTYTIQAYIISSQTISLNNKISTWGVRVVPDIPIGTTISFKLNVNSNKYISSPGSGTSSPSTIVYKNNVVQPPSIETTDISVINRQNCSPYTTEVTNYNQDYMLTMTKGDVITGLSSSTIYITNPQSDSGCSTQVEQDIYVSTLSPTINGCTCCNVVNDSSSKGGVFDHIVTAGQISGGGGLPAYVINIPQQPITPGSYLFSGGTIVVNSAPVTLKLRAFGGATSGGSTIGYITISAIGSFSTPTAVQYATTETSITIPTTGTYYVTAMFGNFVGTSGNSVSLV